ncbi:MAG: hypothetical protein AB1422_09155 [bacterium]
MDNITLLIKEWIGKAEHDLGMAELALENKPELQILYVSIANKQLKNT